MLANFLIGLREGLEASLIVVILVAYLVKSDRRQLLPWIWSGVAVAIGISLGFGALLTFGPKGLTSQAQEAIGGILSIVAVGLVTWMVMWMAKSAKSLSGELRGQVDRAADAGRVGLAVVALLAVGREGLETALFLWSTTQAISLGSGATAGPLSGAGLGILTAVAIGYLVYRGALRLNLARFFAWTGGFLIVVAAGVLAYGVHDLQEAGFVPEGATAYDVSSAIPESSWYGTLLRGTVNFRPEATVLEVVVWAVYLAVTMTFFVRQIRSGRPQPAAPASSAPQASAPQSPAPQSPTPQSPTTN